ncbi:MAG: HAD family phosphatase [Lachnospiraceae bacterium]|nr:HAD family phosphatase [Lachnospiraceae bacterium]
MIKGVIFDVDGVLLNSMTIWKDLGLRYLKNLGITGDEGLSETLFSMSMEQGAAYMKEQYHLKQTEEEILDGIKKLLEDFYFYEVEAKKGAATLMKQFSEKQIPMVAATSSPRTHIEKALERNHLLSYVQRIYTTSEVGKSKHSPKIYEMAANGMDSKNCETVVFEDSLYALKTAKDAGFITVGVFDKDGEANQAELKEMADIYVKDLFGAISLFEQ